MKIMRFKDVWRNIAIFDSDDEIDWTDINQGGAGTCYIKAAMSSLAEFPDMVRDTIINPEVNNKGIYNVRFFIRGKPWVVTIDDHLVFWNSNPRSLVFAGQSKDNEAIWGAVLEKAWAKVRGNYLLSDGGMAANGIRALTGVPVFSYYSSVFSANEESKNEMWDLLVEADANNYIMAAETAGAGDDQMFNECGVAMSHAYSIIAVFTMTDHKEEEHKMVLMRNPWGLNNYKWRWNYLDPKWTAELVAQVPHEFDPTDIKPEETGVFVVPFEAF